MALENRADVQLISFDISKAFDKVWHKGILHKIRGKGIKESLYQWFEDYSSWQLIKAGVPQGSVPGPILFPIYINDIGHNLTAKPSLVADDTSLS